uniref:DUF424 domain-containing protein n=1 Tax=Candidatus Methanophaga sp. ANME-1 ERB7 TaxID=2759913 RepID=A0A7G9Z2E5_9EURY|nr:hypothetical protein IPKNHHKO_00003 [Methanosarcinales archaeon ANME-1 ERB7]
MMYLKIHDGKGGKVVAVCDRELIGKVLEEGDVFIDLDKYRGFYIGDISDDGAVREALKSFDSANLVGERAVNVALHMNLAEKGDIMYINTTPYIQLYRIEGGEGV